MGTQTVHDDDMILRDEGATKTQYPPHPEGQHGAICIDTFFVKGIEQFNTYKNKTEKVDKVVLRFFAGHYGQLENGETVPLWIDKWFTVSMFEKATLRKFLGQWRGRPLSDVEAREGFRIGDTLNRVALIQVSHTEKGEKKYVNIDTVMALPQGMPAPSAPAGYVRVKDRPPREDNGNGRPPQRQQAPPQHQHQGSPFDNTEDDLPF